MSIRAMAHSWKHYVCTLTLLSILDLELGYTHSAHYALNAVSFSVGLNLGHLVRKGPRQQLALAINGRSTGPLRSRLKVPFM